MRQNGNLYASFWAGKYVRHSVRYAARLELIEKNIIELISDTETTRKEQKTV